VSKLRRVGLEGDRKKRELETTIRENAELQRKLDELTKTHNELLEERGVLLELIGGMESGGDDDHDHNHVARLSGSASGRSNSASDAAAEEELSPINELKATRDSRLASHPIGCASVELCALDVGRSVVQSPFTPGVTPNGESPASFCAPGAHPMLQTKWGLATASAAAVVAPLPCPRVVDADADAVADAGDADHAVEVPAEPPSDFSWLLDTSYDASLVSAAGEDNAIFGDINSGGGGGDGDTPVAECVVVAPPLTEDPPAHALHVRRVTRLLELAMLCDPAHLWGAIDNTASSSDLVDIACVLYALSLVVAAGTDTEQLTLLVATTASITAITGSAVLGRRSRSRTAASSQNPQVRLEERFAHMSSTGQCVRVESADGGNHRVYHLTVHGVESVFERLLPAFCDQLLMGTQWAPSTRMHSKDAVFASAAELLGVLDATGVTVKINMQALNTEARTAINLLYLFCLSPAVGEYVCECRIMEALHVLIPSAGDNTRTASGWLNTAIARGLMTKMAWPEYVGAPSRSCICRGGAAVTAQAAENCIVACTELLLRNFAERVDSVVRSGVLLHARQGGEAASLVDTMEHAHAHTHALAHAHPVGAAVLAHVLHPQDVAATDCMLGSIERVLADSRALRVLGGELVVEWTSAASGPFPCGL
jgi:hypothetical protein